MPTYGPEVLGPPQRDPEQQFWDPAIQTMDPEKLQSLQEQRLRDLVQKVLDTPVPLFARKLAEGGVTSGQDLKSLDDLKHIPLTVKQDLRDSEGNNPPWGDYRFTDPHAAVRLGTSTGTTGTPTISLWTRRDLWIEYESGARSGGATGIGRE